MIPITSISKRPYACTAPLTHKGIVTSVVEICSCHTPRMQGSVCSFCGSAKFTASRLEQKGLHHSPPWWVLSVPASPLSLLKGSDCPSPGIVRTIGHRFSVFCSHCPPRKNLGFTGFWRPPLTAGMAFAKELRSPLFHYA